MKKLLTLVLVAPLLLGGKACTTEFSGVTCPRGKTYSKEFIQAAGRELEQIQITAPHIARMIADYDVTLKAIKVCNTYKRKK